MTFQWSHSSKAKIKTSISLIVSPCSQRGVFKLVKKAIGITLDTQEVRMKYLLLSVGVGRILKHPPRFPSPGVHFLYGSLSLNGTYEYKGISVL